MEMDLKELNLCINQIHKRVDTVEDAIKILTDLKISDRELQLQLINLDEKIKSRDKLFYFLLSPMYASLVGLLIYIFVR